MRGLTKDAADALHRTGSRRRRAARVLRARRAGVTDPAALMSVWSGARMVVKRKGASTAPKPAKGGARTSLEPVLARSRRLFGKGAR